MCYNFYTATLATVPTAPAAIFFWKIINLIHFNTLIFFKPKDLEYITGKCYFPYEYMDDKERLKETTLPPKDEFYNSQTEFHISDKAYTRMKYGIILNVKLLVNILTCTSKWMYCCWLMFSRTSVIFVFRYIIWTQPTKHVQDWALTPH